MHTWDPVCGGGGLAGSSSPTRTPTPTADTACPADGMFCDSQCGRFFYQCWGGVRGQLMGVAPGTRCYASTEGALDPT